MKKFALFVILAIAVAFPALALAKKIDLSGGVVKDPDSRISLTVTLDGKKPKKITHFKGDGVDIRCGTNTYESFGSFKVTGAIPVNRRGTFKARIPNTDHPDEKLRISGNVGKGARTVSGNVKTNKLTSGNMTCDVPKQHFELTK